MKAKKKSNFGFIFLVFLVLVFSGCAIKKDNYSGGDSMEQNENTSTPVENNFEKVNFVTDDGFVVVGNLFRGNSDAVVLMHQLNTDKSSYDSFAKKLNDANFTVLAIDLRGHGESLEQNGLKRNWQDFSEEEFRRMLLDVKAAKKFLEQEGFKLRHLVGSSIGANTALNYAANDASIRKIILLSPGMDFKGISTEGNAIKVTAKTLFVASEEDTYSFGSSKSLARLIPEAEVKEIRGAGHGTNMFQGTMLENELVEWLSN